VFLTFGKNFPQAEAWYTRLYEERDEIETVVPELNWAKKADGNFRIEMPPINLKEVETPADCENVLRLLCIDTNHMVNAFRHRLVKFVRENDETVS
jgi:hypothetical protein